MQAFRKLKFLEFRSLVPGRFVYTIGTPGELFADYAGTDFHPVEFVAHTSDRGLSCFNRLPRFYPGKPYDLTVHWKELYVERWNAR